MYDGGLGKTNLSQYSLVFYAVNKKREPISYFTVNLDKKSTDNLGYFLVGNKRLSNADLVLKDNSVRNGPAAIALYNQPAKMYPKGSKITLSHLVDAVVYDTNDPDNASLLSLLKFDEKQLNENENGNATKFSLQRCPNGVNYPRRTNSYQLALPTPKTSNRCRGCGDQATKIHQIQGSTDVSLEIDKLHTIEAVVTGLFLGKTSLNGLFVQEEDSDMDNSIYTSEGLFLHHPQKLPITVNRGDLIRVTGMIKEYHGLTEMTNISGLHKCSSNHTISATELSFPIQKPDAFEALENMRIRFKHTMWILDNNDLGQYGTLTLAPSPRIFQTTQQSFPDPNLFHIAQNNILNQILLDDGIYMRFTKPIRPFLSAQESIRKGDNIQDIDGILTYGFKQYRINPIAKYTIGKINTRRKPLEKNKNLRIVSLNVLNYFNGSEFEAGFTNSRGADSVQEFKRQKAKIIAALFKMDADIIGIMEVENDGFGLKSAIHDLTVALNNAVHKKGHHYEFIDPGEKFIGEDEITVGLLYRRDTVKPIGKAMILDKYPFNVSHRQPLAQTFESKQTKKTITVAVNHFKSKNCSKAKGLNKDQRDGQGCWNKIRVEAAKTLVKWLETISSQDIMQNIIIVGDLNAYANEDPIVYIKSKGYTDLVRKFIGKEAYSYVYKGISGYLDHALANKPLQQHVRNISIWHINADEPSFLDYNLENKSKIEETLLYAPNEFRSSDHDPVIIDIELI